VLLGLSGEMLPIPVLISTKPVLPLCLFSFRPLLGVTEELRGAEQELMTSAGIIQHT